jgi:glycosyltransferase involved in cell wall biosynthesis
MRHVAFIKVHPPYLAWDEDEWTRHEYRERWLPRQAASLGVRASLFVLGKARNIWSCPDEVDVTFFPVDDLDAAPKDHTSQKLLERLRADPPDLLVFKGLGYRLSSWLLEETGFRLPYAFIVGGGMADRYLAGASYVLCETEEQRVAFQRAHLPTAILPKALDSTLFRPGGEKQFDIVNVGMFRDGKNQQALRPLAEQFRVVLVGDGPLVAESRTLFGSRAIFTGILTAADVAETVRRSRVMVHPSLSEGFPRALAESLACGVPVVAFRQVVRGVYEDGRHGLLLDEPSQLVSSVRDLLETPERLERMSRECLALSARWSRESTVPVLEQMIRHALPSSLWAHQSSSPASTTSRNLM